MAKHRDLGILFVAAAGNDGKLTGRTPNPNTAIILPARISLTTPTGDWDSVISVANSESNDKRRKTSNWGKDVVDLARLEAVFYLPTTMAPIVR